MISPLKLVLSLVLLTSCLWQNGALAAVTDDWVRTVQAEAIVQASPPQIVLQWKPEPPNDSTPPRYGATGFTIYRKAKTATSWGNPIANLDGSAVSYADNSVSLGSTYEYQIVKSRVDGTLAYGYVYS